ncbi:MAG: pantetheine-phosphate adenylyltransferase [Peptoniphilaceae bacterium]|nr:pantetheine-phosphate adenylyltransferase [Peptoniphilaceae bacterium]MDY6019399.1 pantetheine-phosphate adenylyltransferase [Anaerococcus sp.]
MRAIYPGSFDPLTIGHLDIITRMNEMFDEVIVAILINEEKKHFFTLQERKEMILKEIENYNLDKVTVMIFDGLLVNFAKKVGAKVVVRGLRAVTDYEYETKIAQFNSSLYPGLETVFLLSDPRYSYISSSGVREVAHFKGDVSPYVTQNVEQEIKKKFY